MPSGPKPVTSFDSVSKLHADGRLVEAEQAYRQFAAEGPHREAALSGLADLYLQAHRVREAVATFVELTNEATDNFSYFARLATLLDTVGQTGSAVETYERFLSRNPERSTAYFNLALLYKKQRRFSDAVNAYQQVIRIGIDRPHEVHSNMGVLFAEMHQSDRARQSFERALKIDATYIPAIFNLAGFLEESGDRQEATTLYEKILRLDPEHGEALARLAYLRRVTDVEDPLIKAITHATTTGGDRDPPGREALFFALGKVLDDVGNYEGAFAAYRSANELGQKRNKPYDLSATEQEIEQLIEIFSTDRVASIASQSDADPIFICGMFRSGSTLVEQILAAHPSVTAGGELDFLPWIIANRLAGFPRSIDTISKRQVHALAEDYTSKTRDLFPDAQRVTDKRPENFKYLGLIKAMFPGAKIVYTLRNIQDNCLSVYFQQLGANLNYATDLDDIAHFYGQHERLMQHWQSCLGENIFLVNYDELVRSPEPILRRLLDFLGLDWHDGCLQFHQTQGLVKTASLWQVREELHTRSSGRWQNYAKHAREISEL
jgi:tetratricopeptide (TPR) repeat protein